MYIRVRVTLMVRYKYRKVHTPIFNSAIKCYPVDYECIKMSSNTETSCSISPSVSSISDVILKQQKSNGINFHDSESLCADIRLFMQETPIIKNSDIESSVNSYDSSSLHLLALTATNIYSRGSSGLVSGSIPEAEAHVNGVFNGSTSGNYLHLMFANVGKKRKMNVKDGQKNKRNKRSFAFHTRRLVIKRIRYIIMNNIRADINSMASMNNSTKLKYDPIPILVISKGMIKKYIGFDNVLILNNPRFDVNCQRDLCYDTKPKYLGKNLKRHKLLLMQYGVGIKLYQIPGSRVAMLCSMNQFKSIISEIKKRFLFITIPDYQIEIDGKNNNDSEHEFEEKYVLLMFARSEKSDKVADNTKWSDYVATSVKKKLRVNMSGNDRNSKHHGCVGKYYGIGLISRYALEDNLSVSDFAGNDPANSSISKLIEYLVDDVNYMIQRNQSFLPNATYCGFSLVSALMNVASKNTNKCQTINNLIQKYDRKQMDFVPISNWICFNAETKRFHQEYDASYTFLSVPHWSKKSIDNNNELNSKPRGTANFIFKWTSGDINNHEHRYLPIMMNEGCTIFFSGYGCYHRQHRTNNADFWNYATYQNRQFYHKMRMSIIRNLLE